MILITGGTGLIGSHLILRLLEQSSPLRVLYRSEEKKESTLNFLKKQGALQPDTIEWVRGDILDVTLLNKAMNGATTVYHCAALISFDPRAYRKLRKVNIEGTANVVNACIQHGIEKLCFLSSIAALGDATGKGLVKESQEWNPQQKNNVYAITKYGAEMEVWRGSQEGLKCVIFNPGVVLGEGLWEQSTGKFFKAVDRGLSYYPQGGTGFVDVKDVVEAMIRGMERPITHEKFILVGQNLTFKELFTVIATHRNKKPPVKKLPQWVLELFWRLDWVRSYLFLRPRKLSKATARSSGTVTTYDNSKAREVLDMEFTPVRESVRRIAEFH